MTIVLSDFNGILSLIDQIAKKKNLKNKQHP